MTGSSVEALTARQSATALRDVLELIDAGSLEATTAERAFIAGSILTAELSGL